MKRETAKAKMDAQKQGIAYGCHVDLAEDEQPDGCVKDYGVDGDCIYAGRHRTREGCPHWRRVEQIT